MSFSFPHHNSFPSHHHAQQNNFSVNNLSSKPVYEFFSKPSSVNFSIQQEIQAYTLKQQPKKDPSSPSSPYRNKATPTVLYVPTTANETELVNNSIPNNILSGIYSKYGKQIRENLKLHSSNKRVISVGFLNIHEQAVDMVNQIVGTSVFLDYLNRESTKKDLEKNFYNVESFPIETHFDTQQNIIYSSLTLQPPRNQTHLMQKSKAFQRPSSATKKVNSNDELEYKKVHISESDPIFRSVEYLSQEREFQLLKPLLFLFHLCHVIIFVLPNGKEFSLDLVRLLGILQVAKQNTNNLFLNSLSNSQWTNDLQLSSLYSPGRILPVVSFLFTIKKEEIDLLKSKYKIWDDYSLLEKLHHSLENQVRTILRKGKFSGTDNSKAPLIMLDPASCVLVTVERNHQEVDSFEQFKKAFSTVLHCSDEMLIQSHITGKSVAVEGKYLLESVKPIHDFIDRQFDYFSKQMQLGKKYILPSALNWFYAALAFEEMLLDKTHVFHSKMEKIRQYVSPDLYFSEMKSCNAYHTIKEKYSAPDTLQSFSTKEEFLKQVSLQFDTLAVGLFAHPLKILLLKEMENIFISWEASKKQQETPIKFPQLLLKSETQTTSLLDAFSYTLEFPMEFIEKISAKQVPVSPISPSVKPKQFHTLSVSNSIDCKCCLLIKSNDVSQLFDFKTGTLLFADHQYLPHSNQFIFFEITSVAHSQFLQQYPDNNTFATIIKSLQDAKSGNTVPQHTHVKRQHHKKRNMKMEDTSMGSFVASSKMFKLWLGVEYKLDNGKKFMLNFAQLQSLKQRKDQQSSTSNTLLVDYEIPFSFNYQNLIGNMTNSGDSNYQRGRKKGIEEMAKLCKMVFITPDSDDCILFHPTLQMETSEGVLLFKPAQYAECATVLPRSSYVSVSFEFGNTTESLLLENLILTNFVSLQTVTR